MPDYRSMFDRDYIGAWDLNGKDVTVTIAKVERGELTSRGNKKDHKPVLYFVGKEKALALNKTNAKTVAKLYGNDTSNWIGKAIVIYPTTTEFGKETVDCIRIRPTRPAAGAKTEQARTCDIHGEFYGEICRRCVEADAVEPEAEAV